MKISEETVPLTWQDDKQGGSGGGNMAENPVDMCPAYCSSPLMKNSLLISEYRRAEKWGRGKSGGREGNGDGKVRGGGQEGKRKKWCNYNEVHQRREKEVVRKEKNATKTMGKWRETQCWARLNFVINASASKCHSVSIPTGTIWCVHLYCFKTPVGLGIHSLVFWANRSFFCEQKSEERMSERAKS